jgi:hypothetical protein
VEGLRCICSARRRHAPPTTAVFQALRCIKRINETIIVTGAPLSGEHRSGIPGLKTQFRDGERGIRGGAARRERDTSTRELENTAMGLHESVERDIRSNAEAICNAYPDLRALDVDVPADMSRGSTYCKSIPA